MPDYLQNPALLIALLFAAGMIAAFLKANARNAESILAGAAALFCAVQMALSFPAVSRGEVLMHRIEWLPQYGLNLVFRVDGFAWLFSMLVLAIGTLVVVYARYYMSPKDPVPRFFGFLMAFMASMLGVVTSGNLVQLVLFWELTSLFSFLLIGYWHHWADARRGARMALIVTGTGGLCLLTGVLVIGHIVGSYELEDVLAQGSRITESPLYPAALALVLMGALTKSAQFPFHFWLPRAMAAPTPVSAYLHSATMVKLGVFLLARLWPVLSGTNEWFYLVGGAGAITFVLGAYAAIFHTDLKGLLAYSTISHLGLITLLLGLNSPLAAVAAVFHIMNHATFKASLFMAAGIIDHETGTRDIRRLSGLLRPMPITGTLALIASAAMAGVPLLNGFLSKEMFFAETVFVSAAPWVEHVLPLLATVGGVLSVCYSLHFTVDVFFGPPAKNLPKPPHEPTPWMRIPIELLVLTCLVVGIVPQWSVGNFLRTSAKPVVGGDLPEFSLAIWHGWNLPFVMSLVALGGGTVLYMLLRPHFRAARLTQPPLLRYLDGPMIFQGALRLLTRVSRTLSQSLAAVHLQSQLFLVVGVAVLAAAAPLWAGLTWGDRPRIDASPVFALLWTVGAACALGTAWQAKFHRLASMIMLSVVGIMTCVTFVWFSAPDLALTQLTVEAVTTVLLLLGLRWMPKRVRSDDDEGGQLWSMKRLRRGRDLLLSLAAGAGMAALAYAMLTRPTAHSISPFFLAKALPEGGGTNVVNVMLVDFRGLDTLGEITVLSTVALTVYALLRRFRPPRESIERPRQQQIAAIRSTGDARHRMAVDLLVPTFLARLMLPLATVVSIHLFMRGHNEPGGGFIAGLVLSIGVITQYIMSGTHTFESRMRLRPVRWISTGLVFALGTGAGAIAAGYPFLTSHVFHFTLPLLGALHLPSAFFFDLGVFAAVVGSTLLILTALAHQSVRRHRRPGRSSIVPLPERVPVRQGTAHLTRGAH